jgi:hypothetical protein
MPGRTIGRELYLILPRTVTLQPISASREACFCTLISVARSLITVIKTFMDTLFSQGSQSISHAMRDERYKRFF